MENNIKLEFIKPGSPYQNGFVERFSLNYRDEVLEVREITDEWLNTYNYELPHDSLGNMIPISYLEAA